MKSIKCVIHCRVSTAKQAYQGDSLDTQEKICREIADRNGWKLAHKPWLEAYSGRKAIRPKFNEILNYLDEHPGEVQFYIIRSLDRFTRDGAYAHLKMKRELAERGVTMVDSTGIIQPAKNLLAHVGFEYDWSRTSPSDISEVVIATAKKAEVSEILTRMIGQEILLTQQGYKIRYAADGFVNKRIAVDGKRRVIQVPDPERAHYFKMLYELRAAGQLSDLEIVRRVNAAGYRSKKRHMWNAERTRIIGERDGVPLTVQQMQAIIKRPIYAGIVCEKWTNFKPIRAAYDGLVSIDTYNEANRGSRFIRETDEELELLHNHREAVAPRRLNPEFPLKNVILCPTCRNPMMGSSSRSRNGSRVPAYHCARNHRRIAFSKAEFESIAQTFISQLVFQNWVINVVAEAIWQKYGERTAQVVENAAAANRTVAGLKSRQAAHLRTFEQTTSKIIRSVIEDQVTLLQKEIDAAELERDAVEVTESEIKNYIRMLKDVCKDPVFLLEQPTTIERQKAMWTLVFDGLPTIDELRSGTAKLSPVVALCEGFVTPAELSVRLPGLYWNHIVEAIRCSAQYTA